jgi:hypothetical protein
MVRYGTDSEDTHESMQMRRLANKYDQGRPKRHAGQNRLRHRGDNSKPVK